MTPASHAGKAEGVVVEQDADGNGAHRQGPRVDRGRGQDQAQQGGQGSGEVFGRTDAVGPAHLEEAGQDQPGPGRRGLPSESMIVVVGVVGVGVVGGGHGIR